MSVIVKIIGAWGGGTPHDGRYLVSWNSNTRFGTLHCVSTADPLVAKRFDNGGVALEEWGKRSVIDPNRPNDGRPNRPLTALTVEIVQVKE